MTPGRQRSRLVEQNDVYLAHPLESQAVLDEDAVASGERGRDRDDEQDCKTECGAGTR